MRTNEDVQRGRKIRGLWLKGGWVYREEMSVKVPGWPHQVRLVARENAATGVVTLALEGIQVE